MNIKNVIFLCALLCGLHTSAQRKVLELTDNSVEEKREQKGILNAEIEFYPRNLVNIYDQTIKLEHMFDYHKYLKIDGNTNLIGTRYYNDVNLHLGKREMTDLIWFDETYIGWKYLQAVVEVGSISGQEYVGFGLQVTLYDKFGFERLAVNSCSLGDVVHGYEYASKEFKKLKYVYISSTGTGRYMPSLNKFVLQTSLWFSLQKTHNVRFGFEYENNNSHTENQHELFLGAIFIID